MLQKCKMVERSDRVKKLKGRKDTSETVVKCFLNKLIIQNKEELVRAIQTRVEQCSERLNYASISINLLIRELFDGVDDVTKVSLPDFWDQTFLRQAMLGMEGTSKPDKYLETFFKKHPDMVSAAGRTHGDSNIYVFAAIKFGTNIRNHLVLNFQKIFKLYIYNVLNLNGTEGFEVQKKIYGWKDPKKKKEKTADREKVKQAVTTIRKIVGNNNLGEKWFKTKTNLKKMLRLFIFVFRELEKKQDQKLYNLLPICRIRNHFITIDTKVLLGMLKEINLLKNDKGLKEEQWASIFKIDSLKTRATEFTGTIDTDGVAVCVHFVRPKPKKKGNKDISLENKRVVAVDPGRRNIFTMVELVNKKWKVHTLTRQHYYQESGISDARKRNQKWTTSIQENIDELSKASYKGQSLDSFLKFVEVWKKNKDILRQEYTKKKWSKERMAIYGKKKKTFAKFFNKIIGKDDPKNIVLAYGSAKFAPGGKGEMSVPTSRAFKECSYRFLIKLVDEYRTSRLFWRDHSVLKTVQKEGKNVSVNGLLWCCSTNPAYANKFVNRDINAAKNIYTCATEEKRPEPFDRKGGFELSKKQVGTKIR
jgi:hypothetical protein